MKLNKKGQAILGIPNGVLLGLAICIAVGHPQYAKGNWGKNGTDNLKARQDKIVANGGHINTAPNSQRKTFDYYVQP